MVNWFIFPPERVDRVCHPLNGHQVKRSEPEVDNWSFSDQRLRMTESVVPFHHIPSWSTQGQLCFYLTVLALYDIMILHNTPFFLIIKWKFSHEILCRLFPLSHLEIIFKKGGGECLRWWLRPSVRLWRYVNHKLSDFREIRYRKSLQIVVD
jgi:hypothetical protein